MDSLHIAEYSLTVKLGDVIKLSNKLRSDYEPLLVGGTNTNIQKVYPIHQHPDDFKFVNLYLPTVDKSGERARRLFSLAESSIVEIKEKSNTAYIIITELFEVKFPEAVINEEIKFLDANSINESFHKTEFDLIKRLDGIEHMFLMGLISVQERENLKMDTYSLYYNDMLRNNKWESA